MGVKGVVRRSQDTHFIHSNIDTDIIVEEEPTGPEVGDDSATTWLTTNMRNMADNDRLLLFY